MRAAAAASHARARDRRRVDQPGAVIGAKGTSDNHTMHAADVIARDLIIVVQTDQRLTELRLVV
jgi:hypothetical protein